jgi:UDP-2,3-diacylglucosamine hydrolase
MDLHAPSHWRTLEFHSDVHLFAQEPHTLAAWQAYLAASTADALFILGDLFEVWVGDDAVSSASAFDRQIVASLRASAHQRPTFFIPGNRDFLVGDRFLRQVGLQRLPDPTVLVVQGQRIALSHGDALCTDDAAYQQFRTEVRSTPWQRSFLAQPLAMRQAQARAIRQASESRKQAQMTYVDVNANAVTALMDEVHADVLVHGHTHQPGAHTLAAGQQRLVLSDWCADATPARLEILRLQAHAGGNNTFQRVSLQQ